MVATSTWQALPFATKLQSKSLFVLQRYSQKQWLCFKGKEATWIRRLLYQLGLCKKDHCINMYGDNLPEINLLHSEGHHERSKHIDIYYHYLHEGTGQTRTLQGRTRADGGHGCRRSHQAPRVIHHERFQDKSCNTVGFRIGYYTRIMCLLTTFVKRYRKVMWKLLVHS